jgi:hypothetical protein
VPRVDPERIARLERELFDGTPSLPPDPKPKRSSLTDRLFALAGLSWLVGVPWAIVLTSTGRAAGKADAVYDHGLAGWISFGLVMWPIAVVVLGVVGLVAGFLIAVALGWKP